MIILASQSATRIRLLKNAGINFVSRPSPVDEAQLQAAHAALTPKQLAQKLAIAKAEALSQHYPQDVVIGADQTLDFNGRCLHKAHSVAEAASTISMLSGNSHALHASMAICQGGRVLFEASDTASLKMRQLTPAAIESYLIDAGPDVWSSVGCYHIEGIGVQLFEHVAGDYFTILGLPLLPLLAFLRKIGELKI